MSETSTDGPGEGLTVIALTGKAGAGKDAAAKFLEAHMGFQTVALADGIRESLNALDGRTWAYRKERDAAGMTDRRALQLMGTECREDLGCLYLWMELVAVKLWYAYRYHPEPRTRFVIPDLRYIREDHYLSDVVKLMGGRYELWRISRVGGAEIAESSHSSEREGDSIPVSRWIWNDGTLTDLAAKVLENARTPAAGRASSRTHPPAPPAIVPRPTILPWPAPRPTPA